MKNTALFGLIGKNIGYSFSRGYFNEKFARLGLDCEYRNFDIDDISKLPGVIGQNPKGLNVTIPYKESVIPYLDRLSETAKAIGAVNTIKIQGDELIGYNTDYFGFEKSLEKLLQPHHTAALILGTGGASKSVAYGLKNLGVDCQFVSRTPERHAIGYEAINSSTFDAFQIVINTTPVGTSPEIAAAPKIPYGFFTKRHIAYDLIYNPDETAFLKKAKHYGAITKNGLEMLQLQAEKAWEIWNSL